MDSFNFEAKTLDKRLDRRHLFKRNITVAEIPDSSDADHRHKRLTSEFGGEGHFIMANEVVF